MHQPTARRLGHVAESWPMKRGGAWTARPLACTAASPPPPSCSRSPYFVSKLGNALYLSPRAAELAPGIHWTPRETLSVPSLAVRRQRATPRSGRLAGALCAADRGLLAAVKCTCSRTMLFVNPPHLPAKHTLECFGVLSGPSAWNILL